MSAQPARRGSDDIPYRAVTVGGWCGLFCINESLRCGVGEVVVLWVVGEVDLCTVPILRPRWSAVSTSTRRIWSSI